MAAKLGRYVFRKIGGRIVPIRKGIEVASKAISEMGDVVANYSHKKVSQKLVNHFKKTGKIKTDDVVKVGSGVDFTAFRSKTHDLVMKVEKGTVGTSSKSFARSYPETKDKIAVSKTLANNLPNYGFPVVETEVVRIKRDKRALLQSFQDMGKVGEQKPNAAYVMREAAKIKKDTGLDLDIHYGNVTKGGEIVDTGANLSKSKIRQFKGSGYVEILGIDNHFGTNIKDYFKKADKITESVAVESSSASIKRKVEALRKKGYRMKSSGDGVSFNFVSPDERIKAAESKGIGFKMVDGKLKPYRKK